MNETRTRDAARVIEEVGKGASALWMLSVSVMLGVVLVAGLAAAALAVRATE